MAKPQTLKAHTRKRSGSAALMRLRREGLVPAVVYGKGQDNLNVRLDRKTVVELLSHSASEQILVNLEIEDRNENKLALIQDVQHHPISGQILHMDFHAVREDEVIHAHVPVELMGDAAGVKAGGMLQFLLHSVDISCLPKDLPEKISVEISHLNIGDALHIGDIKFPEGVTSTQDGSIIVALIAESKVSEEPAPAAAPAAAAPAAAAKAPEKK